MIKSVEECNLEECVDVIRTSFQTVADEFGFTRDNAPRFTAFAINKERLLKQYHDKWLMYACFEDEKMVGYYSLSSMNEENACELNNLCVLPEYRKSGYGTALYHDAVSKAALIGAKAIDFGIVEENVRLRRWYEKQGAVHLSTKKFDFFPFTCGYMRMIV